MQAWVRGRPQAGWAIAVPAAIIGIVVGRVIRFLATSPGFASLDAFALSVLVGAIVLLGLGAYAVLLVTRRTTAAQIVLMPAIALGLATLVGAATGPTYQAARSLPGAVTLAIDAPEPVEIVAAASCLTAENSDTIVRVSSPSMGWIAGERVSLDIDVSDATTGSLELSRGQEAASTGEALTSYGPIAGTERDVQLGARNLDGTINFIGLGALDEGSPWGGRSELVLLDGMVKWHCDETGADASVTSAASGTLRLTGAVDIALPIAGYCDPQWVQLQFGMPPSGKGSDPAEGDPVAGTLTALPGAWELMLFRPGEDVDAETAETEDVEITLETGPDGSVTEHAVGSFSMSYGVVNVDAAWQCGPPRSEA